MSRRPLTLLCPVVDPGAFATARTARAAHAVTLARLALDAAGGHPSQRITIPRTTGGTYHAFYQAADGRRYLAVRATLARRGAYTSGDGVTIALAITDGTTTVAATDPEIPEGLDGTTDHQLGALASTSLSRWTTATHLEWWLSVDDLLDAGLLTSARWRLTFTITCDATIAVEVLSVEEVPRFSVDETEPFGQHADTDFLPRGVIDSYRLPRINATLRWAYVHGRRTYHQSVRPEADPWTVTSATWASIPGDSESAGVPRVYRVRPLEVRGAAADGTRVRVRVRYKTSGAADGYIRLTTGGSAAPYAITLPGTSGAWADSAEVNGYLDTSGDTDDLTWESKVDGGTLSLCTRWVGDDPE